MTASVYYLDNCGVIFYVGICFGELSDRLHRHKVESVGYGSNKKKNEYIAHNMGNIRIFEIERVDSDKAEALKSEQYWIHQFRSWGFPLLNSTGVLKKRNKRDRSLLTRHHIAISKNTHEQMLSFIESKPYSVGKFVDVAVLEKIEREKK